MARMVHAGGGGLLGISGIVTVAGLLAAMAAERGNTADQLDVRAVQDSLLVHGARTNGSNDAYLHGLYTVSSGGRNLGCSRTTTSL